MLIKHDREKLINTIIFFTNNVNKCGKVKLFKLMYFLDFKHYKITGRNVTGMDYSAWEKGPVPVALDNEIKNPKQDLSDAISFNYMPVYNRNNKMLQIIPNQPFDQKHFSKREIKIMEELSQKYKDTLAEDMIEATHLENSPWHVTYKQQKNPNSLIPYKLAYQPQESGEMALVTQEREEIFEAFG